MRKFFGRLLWSILRPGGVFRVTWDVLVLVMLAFVCVETPFVVCFSINSLAHPVLYGADVLVDVFFTLDIGINFRTGVRDPPALSLLTEWRRTYNVLRPGVSL
jgi:hypothetical protein